MGLDDGTLLTLLRAETPLVDERPRFAAFMVRHWRRCSCGSRVETICLNGADAPVREPYYRCSECRSAKPVRLERVQELLDADAQLPLRAPSDRTETLPGTDNEKSRATAALPKPFGEDTGEPSERGGRPQEGGRPQHG